MLLPAYNAAPTLPACLRSIARQTLTDWECLIVEDGSGDETAAVARAAADGDRRFRVLSTEHRGLVLALSAGLSECRGRFVARMDADDLMRRERLAEQVSALEMDASLAGVGAHVRMTPRGGLTPRRREYESWLNGITSSRDVRRDAFVECPVAHPTLMVRGEVLARFGYRDAGWPEDYDLVLRLLATGHELGVVSRRLLSWRDSPARESRTNPRYGVDAFTRCKAHFLSEGFLCDCTDYVLWGYGDTGRRLRSALLRHGRRPSHIVEIKAGRLGQRIHGTPVIPPEALVSLRGARVVVSVARKGPRSLIRDALTAMGFVELRDYVCAA